MRALFILLALVISLCVSAQSAISFSSSPKPGLFAPAIISDAYDNRDMALSPSGGEMFFTIQHKFFSVIMTLKRNGRNWTNPEVASFSGQYRDLEAAFSSDGNKVFFSSNRPLSDTGTVAADYNIWYVEKADQGWLKPRPLGSLINTGKDEFYPSLARNGNLYFTRDNDSTKEDIFVAEFSNGVYAVPQPLPKEVNGNGYDFNAFVDPGEEYIIFTSYKRPDDAGGGDLYISAKRNGRWQTARNMGKAINSSAIDYCPFVSADKKHFFFTSKKTDFRPDRRKPLTAKAVKETLASAGNGSDDIYVVDFEIIRGLLED